MEENDQIEYIVLRHGPTTSLFASKDGTPPSRKALPVKVRVADLAPISPYVIRVAQTKAFTPKPAGSFLGARINFLTNRLILRKKFIESDGTLEFTQDDIRELLGEEATTNDVFASRPHPFRMRAIVMFSIAALFIVMPMRAVTTRDELLATRSQIIQSSKAGIEALRQAKTGVASKDPDAAVTAFTQAEQAFGTAESLSSMNEAVAAIAKLLPVGREAVSGNKALSVVRMIAASAADLSRAFADLKDAPTLTDKMARMEGALRSLVPDLNVAESVLSGVQAQDVPAQVPVETLKATLSALTTELPPVADALALASDMLGANGPQRYLILFQNSNELRPTGGFIGSFALLDVKQGTITNLEIPGDGSYNLQGRQTKRVLAPDPLRILNPQWHFQDSNWFFDFPTSARKAAEFYAKAGGPSVDGVIAINSRLMEHLLALTGPIQIPDTKETVDAKNFVETAQRIAQFDYDKSTNAPKAFIGKLAPVLLEKIASGNADSLMALGDLFSKALHAKDLQVWARNEDRAAKVHAFGWDGAQIDADQDYVALVNTNIAGGKTDGVIAESISDRTTVSPDGRITKTVELTRTHNGDPKHVFTGDTNLTYHRLFVPKAATLISISGSMPAPVSRFGFDETLGRDEDLTAVSSYDVFDAWTELKPGETVTVRFTYTLPALEDGMLASLSTVYDLQSGTARTIKHSITFPADWNAIWHDAHLTGSGSTLSFTREFDHSFVSSVLFKR